MKIKICDTILNSSVQGQNKRRMNQLLLNRRHALKYLHRQNSGILPQENWAHLSRELSFGRNYLYAINRTVVIYCMMSTSRNLICLMFFACCL